MVLHEFLERTRDRWVLVITALFALLSVGIAQYGGSAEETAVVVTAPSLVTLSTFLVPLVALILGHDAIVGERERNTLGLLLSMPVRRWEVLFAKFLGRGLALALATSVGLGSSALFLAPGQRAILLQILPQTLVLGLAFLSIGTLISSITHRVATAASLAVVTWFLLVFFYDLGLLVAMVASDGALDQGIVVWLVNLNPAGLFRTSLMAQLVGTTALEEMGLTVALPGPGVQVGIWLGWIFGPLILGGLLLNKQHTVSA